MFNAGALNWTIVIGYTLFLQKMLFIIFNLIAVFVVILCNVDIT